MNKQNFFSGFQTFVDRGIEYMKVNGRPYRVFKPAADKMYLLPMVSVDDELAHEVNRNLFTHTKNQDAGNH